MTIEREPALVPELLVRDIEASLAFWCTLCGFEISYHRPDEGFAYITRETAHLMLEQAGIGRNWITGTLEVPHGRGINFQISVSNVDEILEKLEASDVALTQPETKWYRVGDEHAGVHQFLVTDLDGYLLRFQSPLARRPAAAL